MTITGNPSGSWITSWTASTLGWLTALAARASRRKRRRSASLITAPFRNFSPTCLRVMRCVADHTAPIPPSPIRRSRR